MSEDGPKVVRMLYLAFNSGDFDGMATHLHAEVELTVRNDRGDNVDEGPYRGIAEVRGLFESIRDRVSRPYFDVLVITPDGDRVVTSVTVRGTVRASDMQGAMPAVHLFTFADGLIRTIRVHRPSWEDLAPEPSDQS